MKDYYQILSILETASQEDIRQAYLRMALIWHPDRHAGESPDRIAIVTACFQEIGEAYGVLSDPVKKNDYDWWLRRSRLTPTMRPTGSSASTPTARTSAGWPPLIGGSPLRNQGAGMELVGPIAVIPVPGTGAQTIPAANLRIPLPVSGQSPPWSPISYSIFSGLSGTRFSLASLS